MHVEVAPRWQMPGLQGIGHVWWRLLLHAQVMRDWELGPALGVGASCVTRLVTDKLSGRTAACKSISKQGILHSSVVKAAMLAVQREVAILQVRAGHCW